jgi:hypothetical protein
MVDPVSTDTSQLLPPAQVTWLSVPVARVHWLVPAQLDVQFEVQVPEQTERASHVLVQPVPQVRSQVPFESQWYVTLFGSDPGVPTTDPSAEPAVVAGAGAPNVHFPPA